MPSSLALSFVLLSLSLLPTLGRGAILSLQDIAPTHVASPPSRCTSTISREADGNRANPEPAGMVPHEGDTMSRLVGLEERNIHDLNVLSHLHPRNDTSGQSSSNAHRSRRLISTLYISQMQIYSPQTTNPSANSYSPNGN